MWVKPLHHTNIQLILGLNFLVSQDRALLLTCDYAVFLSTLVIALILSKYISEFRTPELGEAPITSIITLPPTPDSLDSNCTSEIPGQCKTNTNRVCVMHGQGN